MNQPKTNSELQKEIDELKSEKPGHYILNEADFNRLIEDLEFDVDLELDLSKEKE